MGSAASGGGRIAYVTSTSMLPSFTFQNDYNTGLGRASADNLSLITGGVEAIRIDASQNVGIGVVPEAWETGASGWKALQIGITGAVFASEGTANHMIVSNNYYHSASTGDTYITNDAANSILLHGDGKMLFRTAPIGTGTITWTDAVLINNSGNVSIGNVNDTYKLDVSGIGYMRSGVSIGENTALMGYDAGAGMFSQLI